MMLQPTAYIYRTCAKPFLFRNDPEDVHDKTVALSKTVARIAPLRWAMSVTWTYKDPILHQTVCGIHFRNPVGLAGGFDKNGELMQFMPALGFGFMDVGSITRYACKGNPKPRLWRMPKSESLLVYYGLKNDGVDAIKQRIIGKQWRIPIGTNIAKTNSLAACDDNEAIADYEYSFRMLAEVGDYFTVNISCPNAYGGQPFTDKQRLRALLTQLDKIYTKKPVFIKLSPDITMQQRKDIAELSFQHRVDGFICSNLAKVRENLSAKEPYPSEYGGIGGKMVRELSNELISDMYELTDGKKIIIGCGGVFTGEHAYEKIKRGASLVQMVTGMIFQGPQSVAMVNKQLAALLKRDGYASVADAVGVNARRKTAN